MPWAYDEIRRRAVEALAQGKDYIYSLDTIIEIGEKASLAAGAKKTRPKYTGNGKVYVIDSATRSGEMLDLPLPFPGAKKVRADVHPKPAYWVEVEGYHVGSGAKAKVYKEVVPPDNRPKPEPKPYYTLKLLSNKGGKVEVVPFRQRVLIGLISTKNEVLDLNFTGDPLTKLCNFDAREPEQVQVIGIDPNTGKIERGGTTMSDDYVDDASVVVTPLGGVFVDLQLVQLEPRSDYVFCLSEEAASDAEGTTFAGRSLIVRTEPGSQWLAPLASPLSASDVASRVFFTTLDAVKRLKGGDTAPDPSAGFEVMDGEKWRDYFGVAAHTDLHSYFRAEFGNPHMLRINIDTEAGRHGYMTVIGGKPAWHVEKLRGLIARQKAAEGGRRGKGESRC
jgi:hypothetical protein